MLLSLCFCVSIFGKFFLDYCPGFRLWFLLWTVDSDHSSASHLDLLESDLDRAGTDVEFTILLRFLLLRLQGFVAAPVGEG